MGKKTIYLNASTCTIGGGAQVAANLIKSSLQSERFNYVYAISSQVEQHLASLLDLSKINYEKFRKPSRPVSGQKARRDIKHHVEKTNPDMIFTVFGPSYQNFRKKELMGIADPWLTHATKESYANHGIKERLLGKATAWYKSKWIFDNNYWVESSEVRAGLIKNFQIPGNKITIIPNSCSNIFREAQRNSSKIFNKKLTIAVISASYPHKNIGFTANVINKITEARPDWFVRLITTLESMKPQAVVIDNAIKQNERVQVEHRGNQTLVGCRGIYEEASLVFHPSLLEAYSATYAEAICMNTPLFASDYQFSRAACGDAAIYFDPFDAEVAARKIVDFFESEQAQARLRIDMINRAKDFLSEADRLTRFERLFAGITGDE